MTLIPMPCKQNHVFAAFFAPWVGRAGPARDCPSIWVVLMQQGPPFAFRFEPGSQYSTVLRLMGMIMCKSTSRLVNGK